jgi:hypothetical protein
LNRRTAHICGVIGLALFSALFAMPLLIPAFESSFHSDWIERSMLKILFAQNGTALAFSIAAVHRGSKWWLAVTIPAALCFLAAIYLGFFVNID